MTTDPIVKTVNVGLSPADAFDLFTARMDTWWPLDRNSVSAGQGAASKSLTLTPGMGGELVEIGHDDTRHLWGHVQEWKPGSLVALSWHPGKMADQQTHLRVTFEADGTGTKVTLTHSGWEALDDGAKMRGGYNEGWVGVLERFTATA
ncbi:MAG: hypothetical protein HKN18_12730 [Silicimonas sp.]|nr:hypothetical protein [Silicimonas sp.]